MKGGFGCLGIVLGLLLCWTGCYVHYTTVADIPAASMTLRLEWSGWEWGAVGLVFLLGGFTLFDSDDKKPKS